MNSVVYTPMVIVSNGNRRLLLAYIAFYQSMTEFSPCELRRKDRTDKRNRKASPSLTQTLPE